MPKKIKLDQEEQELLTSLEAGEWLPVSSKEQAKYITAAQNTLKKNKRINIRMSDQDVDAIKVLAAQDGLPYQTLISSILHKFITGQLVSPK